MSNDVDRREVFIMISNLKTLSALSLYTLIETQKEIGTIDKNDKIIFFTSFGIVSALRVITSPFSEETLTNENFPEFALQTALDNAKKLLKENDQNEVLYTQNALILQDVTIVNGSTNYNLPIMILFSDDILGLSFGDQR